MTEPIQEPAEPAELTEPTPEDDEATEQEESEESAPEGEPSEAQPPEGEPPPQVPEASGPQQAEWEDFWKKSERSFSTYKGVVLRNYPGAEGELIEVSISPSAPPGFLNLLDAGRVPDDVQTPVKEFFGLTREQDYKADPDTETCLACDGAGKTKTGSTVAGHETRPCPRCKGWGYTINGLAPSARQTADNGEVAAGPEVVAPLVTDDRDNWGEPRILPDGRENPNYGKQPQFKTEVAPWGVTANLTAQDALVDA